MASRDERKARNIYNESLRRAQAGDTSSYVQGEMQRYGISDPSTAPFRGSGAGNLNPAIDAGKNYIGGLWGGAQRGLDALTQGVAMANENESWFRRNAPNTKRHAGVPMNVRESVMADRDKAFYDKYVKLAGLNPDRKQYYLDQADTARRNLQITKRINYGMGELGLDETPFKGYESYHDGSRFDIDRFSEAMSEYLPGGEEITEDLTETISSPHEIETETIGEPPLIEEEPLISPPGIAYPGYNADITITDLPPETFEKPTDEIFNEEVFNKVYKFPDPTGFTNFPYAFDAPWNLFEAAKENMEEGEWTDQELLDRLIKRGYLIDKTGGEDLEDINLQFDDALEDQAESLNEIERLKNIQRDNNWLFDI